jgi:LAGLIDADG endonuclease
MWSNRKKQKTKKNEASFRVNSLQDLTNCIIPHFANYPLLSPLAYVRLEYRKNVLILYYLLELLNL